VRPPYQTRHLALPGAWAGRQEAVPIDPLEPKLSGCTRPAGAQAGALEKSQPTGAQARARASGCTRLAGAQAGALEKSQPTGAQARVSENTQAAGAPAESQPAGAWARASGCTRPAGAPAESQPVGARERAQARAVKESQPAGAGARASGCTRPAGAREMVGEQEYPRPRARYSRSEAPSGSAGWWPRSVVAGTACA
jgi:hypothetical protein